MLLEIDNQRYSGFSGLSVETSMDALSDTFTISAHNRWIDYKEIGVNSECRIIRESDNEPILDGYIFRLVPSIGEPLLISGRDMTGDLIDCTVSGSTGEFKGRTLKQIIESLVSPFGITVSGEDGSKISIYRHSMNDMVSDVIFDLVSRQGMLANSNGTGNIILTSATTTEYAPFSLQEGVNVNKGSFVLDASLQHSIYTVLGQNKTSSQITSSTDGDSPRFRPLTLINSGNIQIQDAKTASAWRQSVSDGSAQAYEIEVDAIQKVSPNTLIKTESDTLGVNGDLLIRGASFISDKNGSRTVLSLVPPQTFGGNATMNSWIK